MAREAEARSDRRDGGVAWGRLALSSAGAGSLLAFALCAARHADSATGAVGTSVLEAAVLALLAAVAVVGALRAVRPRVVRALEAHLPSAAVASGALALAGTGLFALLASLSGADAFDAASSSPRTLFVAAVSGAAMGSGAALLAMAWAEVLSRLDAVVLVRAAAGAVAVAGAWCAGFRLVGEFAPACAVLASEALAAGGALFFAVRFSGARGGRVCPNAHPEGASCGGGAASPESLLCALSDGGPRVAAMGEPRVRDLYRMLWIPLVGVLFCAFIAGLTWDPVAAYEGEMRSSINDALSIAVGAAAAALALALCARAESDSRVLGLLSRAVQQVALVVVLVVPALQQASVEGWALTAFEAASVGGFALLTAIALVGLVSAARCTGLPAGAVLGGLLAAIAAAMCSGMFAIDAWGTSGRTVCLMLEALFLAAIAVSYALRAHGAGGSAPTPPHPAPQAAEGRVGVEGRCADLAGRAALSPREAEVLSYLGRGHGSAFIAEELGISENTVRTHVRHIYEKLGVASREELLALVNE